MEGLLLDGFPTDAVIFFEGLEGGDLLLCALFEPETAGGGAVACTISVVGRIFGSVRRWRGGLSMGCFAP